MQIPFTRAMLIAAALSCPLSAQIGGGSIVGTVTDPSNAAIVGAHVTATNLGTNETRKALTNQSEYYEFPLLNAGRYRLEAVADGFQPAASAEFVLNTGTRPRIDLSLNLGQVTSSVEVVAPAPLVNATTTDLGVVVERAKVDALPLNGRNFTQLVGLQAGVINAPASSAGGRGGVEFHGSSALANNLMLDGVDMSFGEVNGSAGYESAGGGGKGLRTRNHGFYLQDDWRISQRLQITFRAEAFNALNHVNPGSPNTTVTNPSFGLITGANEGRNVQFALKYQF